MAKTIILDPRQALATTYYRDPKSETFGNLKRSMIKAGFSEKYAMSTYSKDIEWIQQAKHTVRMIEKSEDNLKTVLELPFNFKDKSKFNSDMIKNKINVSMFTLKTLAKAKYDEDAKEEKPSVQINIVNYNGDKKDEVQSTPIDAQVVEPDA